MHISVVEKKEANILDPCEEYNEFECIERAQKGSVRDLDNIINRYRPLVMAKSKSYFLVGADKDDIVQEGMIGLYKAIRDFKIDKDCSFRSFAEVCITRQIITAIKTATRKKHTPLNSYISLNKPVFDKESERTFYDLFSYSSDLDPEKMIINKENYESTESKIRNSLSIFEEDVLMLYLSNQSYINISKILNKDVKSIDNAIQRIKRKLEKLLENKID